MLYDSIDEAPILVAKYEPIWLRLLKITVQHLFPCNDGTVCGREQRRSKAIVQTTKDCVRCYLTLPASAVASSSGKRI